MAVRELLLKTLKELGDEEFKDFKFYLRDDRIPKSFLEKADRPDTVDRIVQTFKQQSTDLVKSILQKISRNDLVAELSRISPETQDPEFFDQSKTSTSPPPPLLKDSTDAPNINNSCKYDEITCKDLIQSGPPAVYQLIPKKKTIRTPGLGITKMTLGVKDLNKTNRTILLVGETGTGKSSLINALVNYDIGVKWEDEIWFEIIQRERRRSRREDPRSDVIVYEIFGFKDKTLPYSLTIIDTPGFGDIRGTEHDDIISQRLFDLFNSEDGVKQINVVGLVLKASENRLNDRLRYILDSVVSLFGKDLENNIVSLITHSYGRKPENVLQALEAANIKCALDEKNWPVHFLFENCQSTEITKGPQVAWETTMRGVNEFSAFLERSEPHDVKTTVDVLKSRLGLTACIQKLKDVEQTEIQEELQKAEQDMEMNENFTKAVEEVCKKKKKIPGGMWALLFYNGAVCCEVCKETCHYPCTMVWYPEWCCIMKDGRCTVCTKECPASAHVKESWIYESTTKTVMKVSKELKEKYDKAEATCENLLKTIDKLEKDKDQWLEESFQHVDKLEKIALNANSLSTHVHLDFLIDKMKKKGDTEKVKKLEKRRSQLDEGLRAGLRYKLTAASKAL